MPNAETGYPGSPKITLSVRIRKIPSYGEELQVSGIGFGTTTAVILVLFILLVIVSRGFLY
ncbi:YjcZ family sporulation protein [Paenibacillus ginsengarvi]|uniref:YjcZ family sporulation protein n=1 Tax=Paenibacillus ginsengarvi TaxID=400777 RepID=A0A3B0CIN5_9BACL|nr:YjcZ family sporulation protein [Paenibacillus ginsengarvi]